MIDWKSALLGAGGLIVLFVWPGATAYGQTTQSLGTDDAPPNVVFVLVDDLGYTDVNPFRFHPDQYYETPNITRLAGQGMQFTNAYASAANCAPTRAALMSGQSYPRQPIYTVNSGARGEAEDRELVPAENETTLPLEKVTVAERLRDAGYATAFMGKWHLGAPSEAGPEQQGFDVNVGGTHTGHPSWEGAYFAPNNNPEIDDARDGEYLTDYLFRKAAEYIRQHRDDEPFYLQLSPYSVHVPLQASEARTAHFAEKPPVRRHDNPTYAAMIKSVDRGVGRIMETLDALGMAENTLLIVYSDNGGLGGYRSIGLEENGVTDHAPLKGGKGSFYEGGIRVPLIVRWPGVVRPGTTTDEPVNSVDFYPTLLDLAGEALPEADGLSGVSFLPVLRDATASLDREALYWHFPGYLQAYGPGDWRTTPVSVVRSGPWKLLKFYEGDRLELYNLDEDIGETRNLARQRPEVRERLLDRLTGWLDRTEAPLPTPKAD
jgi:arylsulfatase A-like enzyme